jgi:N6-adenosine-specific RNA methylase IME4
MPIPLPVEKYPVIYADPPWAYRKAELVAKTNRVRAVEKEYPTMQPEEIAALPIGACAEDNSVLFMWATGPKLPEALMVMAAWGFTFRTIAFVWVKMQGDKPFMGMGFYTRANVELVLVGTRGKGRTRKDAGVRQVLLDDFPESEPLLAEIGEHSRKPAEIRRRIESLYDGPYLELFARDAPDGWRVWGNDVPVDREQPIPMSEWFDDE